MKKVFVLSLLSFFLIVDFAFAGLGLLDRRSAEDQRLAIKSQTESILNELYQTSSVAKGAIESAYGFAVFSNFGIKIFVAGGGTGRGAAVNNQTQQITFMKMAEVQAGLGMGVKKFKLIWIFETESAFNQFVNSGWTLGAQASAAAKYKETGAAYQGAVAISPGVWLYQLTDSGLALELTAKGTKYFKDKELNNY